MSLSPAQMNDRSSNVIAFCADLARRNGMAMGAMCDAAIVCAHVRYSMSPALTAGMTEDEKRASALWAAAEHMLDCVNVPADAPETYVSVAEWSNRNAVKPRSFAPADAAAHPAVRRFMRERARVAV